MIANPLKKIANLVRRCQNSGRIIDRPFCVAMNLPNNVKKSENFADVIYGSPLRGLKNVWSHHTSKGNGKCSNIGAVAAAGEGKIKVKANRKGKGKFVESINYSLPVSMSSACQEGRHRMEGAEGIITASLELILVQSRSAMYCSF